MINRVFLFFLVSILLSNISYSQEINDSIILKERNDAFLNYENYRSSITDTTIDVYKKLFMLQTDLIESDNVIIHKYISTNTKKVDDLQKCISLLKEEKDKSEKKYLENGKWVIYGIISTGVLAILAILFIVLFIITNGKKKGALSQLIKIEKIKEEQLKEICLLKTELETHSESGKKEFQKVKDNLENELKSLKNKYETLLNDKSLIEKKLKEKESDFDELNRKHNQSNIGVGDEMNTLKNNYENQISQLKDELSQIENIKQLIENDVNGKEVLIKNQNNEINVLGKQLAEYKELYEKERNQKQQTGEQLSNNYEEITEKLNKSEKARTLLFEEKSIMENELIDLKKEFEKQKQQNSESSIFIEENNLLKTELNKYKEQLQKENQQRIEIENEIKQLIQEIKGMRK